MYAIVIDNDLLKKSTSQKSLTQLKFETTLLPCLNVEHFQNNGVYFYMYNNKDQR